jgi:hypothetical protein
MLGAFKKIDLILQMDIFLFKLFDFVSEDRDF